jgi:hypothetical protein
MAKFRAKRMEQIEWLAFEQAYELVFQMLGGTADVALFGAQLSDQERLALIPSHKADVVEATSPGDWYDIDEAGDYDWQLVVGHADAPAIFGVPVKASPPRR